MKLSHSKLSQLLTCPMSYYLNYEVGIKRLDYKPALYIGSAVHWGIEHNTTDLSEFYGEDFRTRDNYTRDQLLAEAMVHGYMKAKDNIFEQILTDSRTKEKAKLVDEKHELYISANLKSRLEKHKEGNEFVGIIDLLLLTDKGFVVIDYKTSTYEPNWNDYLDQIYRYIFLLRQEFPDVPVYKIGIINIRKTGIRQKKSENWEQFYNRLKWEYDLDESLVNYHEYDPMDIDKRTVDDYIENLSRMSDTGVNIVDNGLYYINYGAARNQYGKSDYYDIFYHTPDAYILYDIKDRCFYDGEWHDRRPCVALDMKVIDLEEKILNTYEKYKEALKTDTIRNYKTDPSLLHIYEETANKEQEEK